MRRTSLPGVLGFLLTVAGVAGCPLSHAQDITAVLSSDSAAYQEALAGFQEVYGRPVQAVMLSNGKVSLPGSPKVIVAFGGKAAAHPYPHDTTLIYCLAPALWIGPEQHAGPRIRISVAPLPEALISGLQEIQPSLKRLAAFFVATGPSAADYFRDLQRAAEAKGIQLRTEHLARAEDLPDRLRSLAGHVDALWLSPDPLLITPSAFAVAVEFARSNNTPLYAPVASLVDKGASASVSSSFRENGRAAGRVAAQAVAGGLVDVEKVYPENYEIILNLTVAAQSGLTIPPAVIKQANRVVP